MLRLLGLRLLLRLLGLRLLLRLLGLLRRLWWRFWRLHFHVALWSLLLGLLLRGGKLRGLHFHVAPGCFWLACLGWGYWRGRRNGWACIAARLRCVGKPDGNGAAWGLASERSGRFDVRVAQGLSIALPRRRLRLLLLLAFVVAACGDGFGARIFAFAVALLVLVLCLFVLPRHWRDGVKRRGCVRGALRLLRLRLVRLRAAVLVAALLVVGLVLL
jgi:hypothetical protein